MTTYEQDEIRRAVVAELDKWFLETTAESYRILVDRTKDGYTVKSSAQRSLKVTTKRL